MNLRCDPIETSVKYCVWLAAFALLSLGTRAIAEVDGIDPGSWTLAILPDTQYYAESYPEHFSAQTQWIKDNRETLNIQYVLHEGDVVNNNNIPQWNVARSAMSVLDGAVPYAIAPGNHDYGTNGNAGNRGTVFNHASYFGPGSPYATQTSVGGFFEDGKTDNSYHTFSAGGSDWLVLALEFGPRDQVVAWANDIVEQHPDHLAILLTHAYMYYDETIYDWATKGSAQSWNPHSYGLASLDGGVNDGQELWDKLVSKQNNFRFTFNGHVLGDGTGRRSTRGDEDNIVHQLLANYQFKSEGGDGDLRLLEFKTDGSTVEVKTYSPVLDRHDRAEDQEFTLYLNSLTPPVKTGDYNGDGEIDQLDYAAWKLQFAMAGNSSADGNGDGTVDAADYTIWRDAYESQEVTGALPVPEPCGSISVTIGLMSLLSRLWDR